MQDTQSCWSTLPSAFRHTKNLWTKLPNSPLCQSFAYLISEHFCIRGKDISQLLWPRAAARPFCPVGGTGEWWRARNREKPGCFSPPPPASIAMSVLTLSPPWPTCVDSWPVVPARVGQPSSRSWLLREGRGSCPLVPPPPPACPSPGAEQFPALLSSFISCVTNSLFKLSPLKTPQVVSVFLTGPWPIYHLKKNLYTTIQQSAWQPLETTIRT